MQDETHRLLSELYRTDVLRADRMISCWGLEGRFPFLDADLTNFVTGLDPSHKMPQKFKVEKYLLRSAFEGFLPDEILWRQKMAFSDGISTDSVKALKEYAKNNTTFHTDEYVEGKAIPNTEEADLYYSLFRKHYSDISGLYNIEYWMPRWTDATDPSATVLDIHSKQES